MNEVFVKVSDIFDFEYAIFDLDGTILDSSDVWSMVDEKFLSKRGIPVTNDYLEEIKKHNFESGAIYTVEKYGLKEDPKDIEKEWFDEAYKAYRDDIILKPGAYKFIKELVNKNVKLAVATSSDEILYKECLIRNGVYDFFDAIVQTKEVKRGKQFPDVYLEAARRIGGDPRKCVVFEDLYMALRAAKTAGFTTVGVYDKANLDDIDKIKEISDLYIEEYI
jgi:HAD superfamily hydrolase (TIGR01509 family)